MVESAEAIKLFVKVYRREMMTSTPRGLLDMSLPLLCEIARKKQSTVEGYLDELNKVGLLRKCRRKQDNGAQYYNPELMSLNSSRNPQALVYTKREILNEWGR